MREKTYCLYCDRSEPRREKDQKIRCKRFSEWRDLQSRL